MDRESAQVQAVVTLFAQSSFATVPLNADVHALLDPLIQQKGQAEALIGGVSDYLCLQG